MRSSAALLELARPSTLPFIEVRPGVFDVLGTSCWYRVIRASDGSWTCNCPSSSFRATHCRHITLVRLNTPRLPVRAYERGRRAA